MAINNDEYQFTGNNLPIDPYYSSMYVMALLSEYDNRMKRGNVPSQNPYKDEIVMKLQDGKFVKVPSEIQSEAVKKWLSTPETERDLEVKNNRNNRSRIIKHIDDSDEELNDAIESDFIWTIVKVLVIFAIVMVILYFAYRANKI